MVKYVNQHYSMMALSYKEKVKSEENNPHPHLMPVQLYQQKNWVTITHQAIYFIP